MSNGAISLLITLLMKFKGKRLKQNQKYHHSAGQYNMMVIPLSLLEVCQGGERLQISLEWFNLWPFQLGERASTSEKAAYWDLP